MAIQLLQPSLMGEFTHILSRDPALDTEAEGFAEAYEQFLEHGTMPPLKPGEDPTIFTLKLVSDAELDAKIRGKLDNVGSAWSVETASYCLRSIKNLRDEDGNEFVLKFERVDGFEKVCREHRNLLGREILAELGSICIGRQSPS